MSRNAVLFCAVSALVGCSANEPADDSGTGVRPDVVVTSDEGSGCETPLSSCGGMCVDTASNALNCGACGRRCETNAACVDGACRISCAAGQTVCSGECVDLRRNALHCGACGRSCRSGESCESGRCSAGCASPRMLCTTICVDPQSDQSNCGGCGLRCAMGESCSNGRCALVCPVGQQVCDGRCIDTSVDRMHCGRCGNACDGSQFCSAGACRNSVTADASVDASTDAPADVISMDVGGGALCGATNLGSALGSRVATGSTVGRPGDHTPPGTCTTMPAGSSPDVSFLWTAPSAGTYTFDLAGSSFDTILTLRRASCLGTPIDCSDDIGAVTTSRVTATLSSGQIISLSIDGFGGATGNFVLGISVGAPDAGSPDAFSLDASSADPCAMVPLGGRCVSTTTVEECAYASGGAGPNRVVRYSCFAGEQCQIDPARGAFCRRVATCLEGETQCLGPTQLRRCVSGAWVNEACPRECIESPLGAFCAANVPVRQLAGSLVYEYRGINHPMAPTNWSSSLSTARAQGFLVFSMRRTSAGITNVYDINRTALGTSDGGGFSIRVPASPTSQDVVEFYAMMGNESGKIEFAVASPELTTPLRDVEINDFRTDAARVWGWSWRADSIVNNAVLTVRENMGGGAARVFDYLRYTRGYLSEEVGYQGVPLIVWVQPGISWKCGACLWNAPVTLFGTTEENSTRFLNQGFIDGGSATQAYWSDAVTAHELGHWAMNSYSAPGVEAGRHQLGGIVYPGMAWSEGFATWLSADVRRSWLYYDKQYSASGGTSFFWFNLGSRTYGPGVTWRRPQASLGLEQRIDENEVAAMLWRIRSSDPRYARQMYRALASARMSFLGLFLRQTRGYRAWFWTDLDRNGDPVGAVRRQPEVLAYHLADFFDALLCSGFSRTVIDNETLPTAHYPYPSGSPLCF